MQRSRRALVIGALAVGLVGVVGGQASADHEYIYTPTTTRYFMSNDSAGCPGTPFLSTTAGSGEVGCGFQGGAPFGELYHAGGPVASTIKTYATQNGDGTPTYLDPTRDATGNVTVVATATTNRMAAGQIRVDVTLRARNEAGQSIVLGTHTSEQLVNPTNSAEVNFPFTMNTNDALDKVRLNEVSIDVDIRGWHVLTGYHRLNGQSYVDLPAYIRTVKPHDPPPEEPPAE
jgi:hypothetical protein